MVKKGDAQELYNAMETLYASKELRDEMGRNALEFATASFEQKTLFEKICNDRRELIEKSTAR